MSTLIKVLVVDNHQIVRRGLAMLLIARNGMQVVGEAATGEEAIAKARTLNPDVILMALNMPGIGGPTTIGILRTEAPHARILVLTTFDDNNVPAALQAGALGYLRKDSSPDELFEALHKVAAGASYLTHETVQKFVNGFQGAECRTQDGNHLTAYAMHVLTGLAQGISTRSLH